MRRYLAALPASMLELAQLETAPADSQRFQCYVAKQCTSARFDICMFQREDNTVCKSRVMILRDTLSRRVRTTAQKETAWESNMVSGNIVLAS